MAIIPTQSNAQAMLKNFLASVLPSDVAIVTAQQNRVAEPQSPSFVVMTPIRFTRLRTNVVTYNDARFVGSIAGSTLTISDLTYGTVGVSSTIFGPGVIPNTTVTGIGSMPGIWVVSPQQTVPSQVLAAGTKTWEQGAELVIQLDFHTADTSLAGDYAQTVTTMFRTSYAVDQFAEQTPTFDITPLHADDTRMVPFINEAQQWEWRWIVDAHLQVNDVVTFPLQFAESLTVDVISVEAESGSFAGPVTLVVPYVTESGVPYVTESGVPYITES